MVDFTETAMRKMCRNPRCGCKLLAPVSNPREAFCAKGCHTSFYRTRCRVCEGPIEQPKSGGERFICKKSKCFNAWKANSGFGRFHPSSDVKATSETPIKPSIKLGLKPERTPLWRVIAAGAPISANQYHCAIVGAEEATAVADRINAAHWRAARAGERSYRLPDLTKPEVRATPHVAAAMPILPDDLSIPIFLLRRAKPLAMAA
jgi:hypothetical protein